MNLLERYPVLKTTPYNKNDVDQNVTDKGYKNQGYLLQMMISDIGRLIGRFEEKSEAHDAQYLIPNFSI